MVDTPKRKRGRPRKVRAEDPTPEPTPEPAPQPEPVPSPEPAPEAAPDEDETPTPAPEPVQESPIASTIKATGVVNLKLEDAEVMQRFSVWLGVGKSCPYQNCAAGGQDFPRWTERMETVGGTTSRTRVNGKVVEMTRSAIERVAQAVGRKVVRWAGSRAFILNVDSPRYMGSRNDEPLGKYLYMQVVGDLLPPDWRTNEPEMMV